MILISSLNGGTEQQRFLTQPLHVRKEYSIAAVGWEKTEEKQVFSVSIIFNH